MPERYPPAPHGVLRPSGASPPPGPPASDPASQRGTPAAARRRRRRLLRRSCSPGTAQNRPAVDDPVVSQTALSPRPHGAVPPARAPRHAPPYAGSRESPSPAPALASPHRYCHDGLKTSAATTPAGHPTSAPTRCRDPSHGLHVLRRLRCHLQNHRLQRLHSSTPLVILVVMPHGVDQFSYRRRTSFHCRLKDLPIPPQPIDSRGGPLIASIPSLALKSGLQVRPLLNSWGKGCVYVGKPRTGTVPRHRG